jgi:hypothetical protein
MHLICVLYGQMCACYSRTDKIWREFEEKKLACLKTHLLCQWTFEGKIRPRKRTYCINGYLKGKFCRVSALLAQMNITFWNLFYPKANILTCRWSNENKPAQICMYESHDNFLYTVTCNNLSRKLVVAENVSYEDRKHRPLYYKTK